MGANSALGTLMTDLASRGIVLEEIPGQATPGTVADIDDRGHIVGSLTTSPDWAWRATLFR